MFLLEPAIFCKFCINSQKKILTLKEILHENLLHGYEYYATPEGVCVFWMLKLNRVYHQQKNMWSKMTLATQSAGMM